MNFRFVTVFWGESYTDLFLKVVLPSQLSAGNLFSFRYDKSSGYKIYTTSKDAESIRKSPVFSKLTQVISTEIICIDDIGALVLSSVNLSYTYEALTECYIRAFQSADGDTAFVILSPDSIWSDGTFAALRKIAASGKRAVMAAGIRAVKETFVPDFLKRFYSEDGFTAGISSRDLVKTGLKHLHPSTKSLFWDSKEFSPHPSFLYWHANHEGILARCFHLHPLLTVPRGKVESMSSTIDGGDYLSMAHPDINELYIAEDSDEMTSVEMSGLMRFGAASPGRSGRFKVAYWAIKNAGSHHRRFVIRKIRFHFKDISPVWRKAERDSDRVVNAVCFLLKFEVLLNIMNLLEFLSPGKIVSTGKKLSGYFTSVPDIILFIARLFLHIKLSSRAVSLLNRYMDYCDKKSCDYEKVYDCACQLQQRSSYPYAEQVFERLREKNYCPWVIYFHLGEISYWFKKDRLKAREYFERVLKLNPEHGKAVRYLDAISKTAV